MSPSVSDYHDDVESPVTISQVMRVLREYGPFIARATCMVALVYAIAATLFYLLTPSVRVVSQPFRLDFPGAAEGKYPNGLKFSSSEIISSQILSKVYSGSQISRFMKFRDFTAAVYITASNPEFDRLQREYQGRLGDPKLSTVERQQIERDFADRQMALPKNFYSLNFAVPHGIRGVPDEVVMRALSQTLAVWANWVHANGQVTNYDVAVLSPAVVDDDPNPDLVVAIRILINRLSQVLSNLRQISELPSAGLARTSDRLSVLELRIKFEELIRFRLEPMVPLARAVRGNNSGNTLRFVQTQLAFDERELQGYQDRIDSLRSAIAVYTNQPVGTAQIPAAPPREAVKMPTETVMPQLNETFIDRIAKLVNEPSDLQYRQKLIDEMRGVMSDMGPVQQAVRYDQELLRDLSAPAPSTPVDEAELRKQIEQVRAQAKTLIVKLNEIYSTVSHNLNPETYLYTTTSPPTTRVYRSVSPGRLVTIGMFTVLLAIPLIAFLCLLHHRMREEDRSTVAALATGTAPVQPV